MTCTPCAVVRQVATNLALAFDRLLNAGLGGSANETLSQRSARAELAGKRVGKVICGVLDWMHPGHCAWSLTPGSIGQEVWAWSPPPPHTSVLLPDADVVSSPAA